jgi:hypothetical protein
VRVRAPYPWREGTLCPGRRMRLRVSLSAGAGGEPQREGRPATT